MTNLAHPRPEAPRTGRSISALTPRERTALRSIAPAVAAALIHAERLHSSPFQRTSGGSSAAAAATEVDRLRRQARQLLEQQAAATL